MTVSLLNLRLNPPVQFVSFANLSPKDKHNITGNWQQDDNTQPSKFIRHTAAVVGERKNRQNAKKLHGDIKERRILAQQKRQSQ